MNTNNKRKNTLILLSYSFPFGAGESFLETEIIYLASSFEKVVVVPFVKTSENCRILPVNTELLDIAGIADKLYKRNIFKKLFLVASVFCFQLFHSKRSMVYLTEFRYYLSYLIHKINVAHELHDIISIKKYDDPVFYSYWFDYLMLPLCVLKNEKKIGRLITRAHGGDVYEYQHNEPGFFFPFRSFQVKNMDMICPVSQDGFDHLKREYPLCADKLKRSRLGVQSSGIVNAASEGLIVIVTCSSFFGYKRLHLVPEILKCLSARSRWIHIGGEGDLKDEIVGLAKSLPERVEVEFKGQLTNKEVHAFYRDSAVSVFLNVSLSEGIPVSIMEAISFGIPVIATDVGGSKEIVNSRTGILLPVDFNPPEAARLLEDNLMRFSDVEFRNGVRMFWEKNYNAEINYNDFINNILPA